MTFSRLLISQIRNENDRSFFCKTELPSLDLLCVISISFDLNSSTEFTNAQPLSRLQAQWALFEIVAFELLHLCSQRFLHNTIIKGQLISKCLFLSSILPKKEQKQFNLRYHSSKVEFFHLFFVGIEDTKKIFRN